MSATTKRIWMRLLLFLPLIRICGDVYSTNQENENPDTFSQHGGYERTQVRKRRNE
jgi:hypothetical protein